MLKASLKVIRPVYGRQNTICLQLLTKILQESFKPLVFFHVLQDTLKI